MDIISDDFVLKEVIKNYIPNNQTQKQKLREENKLFRFIQEANNNNSSNNISFFSVIPSCLKNYQKFHGCGKSPMDNVISLIAGICLFINSKIINY